MSEPRINRHPATATWEHEYRWGTGLGDTSRYVVTRTDGGRLRITRGAEESVEIRRDHIEAVVAMINAAAEWSDTQGGAQPVSEVAPAPSASGEPAGP